SDLSAARIAGRPEQCRDLQPSVFDRSFSRSAGAELSQAALQEAALGLLLREGQRAGVRGASGRRLAEAAAQVGARGVREVVARELAALQQRFDQCEAAS